MEKIPVSIITGFLGSGKTTLLSRLLNSDELQNAALIINEFGEIGIDGALVQGQQTEEQGVFIREVPGGCMCCVTM